MKLTMKISKIQEIIFLVFLAIIFFSSSTIFLGVPGLGGEEAYLIRPAVSIVLKNFPPRYVDLKFFGHYFFVMINAWTGPISALLFIPLLYIFGISVYVIRITRLAYGFITILLLYFFAKDFFDKKTASIASFLLATFPFYIFMYRQGYLDDGILPTFLLAALISFYKFYKNAENKFLYWGAFFTGLGLCSKISFLWFIGAVIMYFLFFRTRISLNKKNILISSLIFNLAILPMTLFNICNINFINTTDHSTIGVVINNLINTIGGQNNLLVHKNILTRFIQLKGIFRNWYYGQRIITNPFYFYILILAVVFYLVRFISFRKSKNQIKIIFIVILLLIMFFFSCFTINYFKIEHAAIYLPLSVLIIAKFLNDVFKKRLKIVKYVIILFITLFNFVSLSESYKILYKNGIYLFQFKWVYPSSAVYALSEYLVNAGIGNPISIGSDLVWNVEILTQGKVQPIGCLNPSDYYNKSKSYLEESVQEKERYYLIVTYNFIRESLRSPFERMLIKYYKTVDIVKIFYRRDGVPDIILFKLKDGKYNNELSQYLFELRDKLYI